MEWFYLVLILAFFFWLAQMLFGYRRYADRADDRIAQTISNEENIIEQADGYEAQVAEKEEELKQLQEEDGSLEKRQKDLEAQVQELKQKEASTRPTRHRVESQGE